MDKKVEIANVCFDEYLRQCKDKKHTSIYVIAECEDDVAKVVEQLIEQGYDLAKVLGNVKVRDLRGNDKKPKEEDEPTAELEKSDWRSYTPTEISRLTYLVNSKDYESLRKDADKKNNPCIEKLFNLICRNTGYNPNSLKNLNHGYVKKNNGDGSSNNGDSEKNVKKESNREMMNRIMRKIERQMKSNGDWNNLYIPAMGHEQVISLLLTKLCDGNNVPPPNAEDAELLRLLINSVYVDINRK